MTTYQTTLLAKPTGDSHIPAATLVYLRTRLRQRIHSMILEEFEKSGLSQAELSRRLGKQSGKIVHRWLSTPENMRLSTLSDLVFAITGGEPAAKVEQFLDAPASNHTAPDWLANAVDKKMLSEKPSSGSGTSAPKVQYKQEKCPA